MALLSKAPDWEVDGADWPHRAQSDFVEAGEYRWHVQRMGAGPAALLIHGTGAATHSWAGLAPLLAEQYDVITFDLPGHGFTRSLRFSAPTLRAVSRSVGALIQALGVRPSLTVGHSAGAAIMIQMMRDELIAPERGVSINGALTPFDGVAGLLFPAVAKFMYYNPFTAYWLSRSAQDRSRVLNLIERTGSSVAPLYVDCYAKLLQRPAHVSGALGMMAHWDLTAIRNDLRRLNGKFLFLAGENDKAVPPVEAERAAAQVSGASHLLLRNCGHLAQEEDATRINEAIFEFSARQ